MTTIETTTRRLLGHTFRPMVARDFNGLAGAEPGSWICELDDVTLVLTPTGNEIAVIDNETTVETAWSLVRWE